MDYRMPIYDPKTYTVEFFGPGACNGPITTVTCSITVIYKGETLGVWSLSPGLWGVILWENEEGEVDFRIERLG